MSPIHACLIIDDFPANPAYWMRLQQTAFGFKPNSTGPWSTNWQNQSVAPLMPLAIARQMADLFDEFDIRGKFTVLPMPCGLGRLDQSVRGYGDGELKELLDLVRDRIAPRFDITPEVLTHTMAMDIGRESLLPHSETAWISWLCAEKRHDELYQYLHAGFSILNNVGIAAHGLTIGGMIDPSNIGRGKSLLNGDHRDELARATLAVERSFRPTAGSFIYTGAQALTEAGRGRLVPECFYRADDGAAVFDILSMPDDICLPALHGQDVVASEIEKHVSSDLSGGDFLVAAEAGKLLVTTTHSQSMNALNTGRGLEILRGTFHRLRQRYGKRLQWHTTQELCDLFGPGRLVTAM